jgi:Luciferase
MNWQMKKLEREIASWPGVSAHPHRFGGREFRFGNAEVGHVHMGGVVDIPFPRAMRDALLAEGFAEEHHWVPNSGWTSFRVRREDQLQHAVWLLRFSYARQAIKNANAPQKVFDEESLRLQLREPYRSLLERFVRPVAEDHSNAGGSTPGMTNSHTSLENGASVEGAAR